MRVLRQDPDHVLDLAVGRLVPCPRRMLVDRGLDVRGDQEWVCRPDARRVVGRGILPDVVAELLKKGRGRIDGGDAVGVDERARERSPLNRNTETARLDVDLLAKRG